jgi:phospholipase D1/2
MAGEPYKVGRFPHTLRMRLMREHLGVDVDAVAEEDRLDEEAGQFTQNVMAGGDDAGQISPGLPDSSHASPLGDKSTEMSLIESHHRLQDDLIARAEALHSYNHDADDRDAPKSKKKLTSDPRVTHNLAHEADVMGAGPDNMLQLEARNGCEGRDTKIVNGQEYLVNGDAPDRHHLAQRTQSSIAADNRPGSANTTGEAAPLPPSGVPRLDTVGLGLPTLSTLPQLPTLDDTDIGAPPLQRNISHLSNEIIAPLIAEMRRPMITRDCMRDPLTDTFFYDTWHTVAENNTKIYRQVFRCQPDNEVKTWKEYREYVAFGERFSMKQGAGKSTTHVQQEHAAFTGPPGQPLSGPLDKVGELFGKVIPGVSSNGSHPLGKVEEWTAEQEKHAEEATHDGTVGAGPETSTPEQNGEFNEKTGEFRNGTLAKKEVSKESSKNGDDEKSRISPQVTASTGTQDWAVNGVAHERSERPTATDSTERGYGDNNHSTTGGTDAAKDPNRLTRDRTVTISDPSSGASQLHASPNVGSQKRRQRRRGTTKSSTRAFTGHIDDAMLEPPQAEELLNMVQGTLVVFPYDWLEREEHGGNWLYTVDQLAPLEI